MDENGKAIERHARLKELFLWAVELDMEDQRRFVEDVCGEDAELRAELESLLDHHLQIEIPEQSDTRNQ